MRAAADPRAGFATFSYHRAVAPMMWAFASLATIELVVVHLVVALRWPWIGWPLSALTLASLVWLVLWIRSFSKLPHRLEEHSLHLHAGTLRHVAIPLADIDSVAAALPE